MTTGPALFRFDPRFAAAFAHHPILAGPTPVQPLERLSREVGGPAIWIKRDDLTSALYGGNKPRKLEFLLGDVRRRGSRAVVTFGVVGSHHALATAIHARPIGVDTTAVLVNGPLHPHAIENLRRTCLHATRTLYLDWAHLPAVAGAIGGTFVGPINRPYLIPPGGSSPLGNLGYVSAALELAEQVRAGQMPRPDYVFVPAGSLGTLAGLVVGFALARLETWVVGIAVLGPPSVTTDRADRMVRRVRKRLIEASPEVRRIGAGFERFSLRFGSLGSGYGHATPEGAEAAQRLAAFEDIQLDATYTAKAMAGMLAHVAQPSFRGKTVLFWHTLNRAAPAEDPAALAAVRLPAPLGAMVANAERRSFSD